MLIRYAESLSKQFFHVFFQTTIEQLGTDEIIHSIDFVSHATDAVACNLLIGFMVSFIQLMATFKVDRYFYTKHSIWDNISNEMHGCVGTLTHMKSDFCFGNCMFIAFIH